MSEHLKALGSSARKDERLKRVAEFLGLNDEDLGRVVQNAACCLLEPFLPAPTPQSAHTAQSPLDTHGTVVAR